MASHKQAQMSSFREDNVESFYQLQLDIKKVKSDTEKERHILSDSLLHLQRSCEEKSQELQGIQETIQSYNGFWMSIMHQVRIVETCSRTRKLFLQVINSNWFEVI